MGGTQIKNIKSLVEKNLTELPLHYVSSQPKVCLN